LKYFILICDNDVCGCIELEGKYWILFINLDENILYMLAYVTER